jgi:hypothetical protein
MTATLLRSSLVVAAAILVSCSSPRVEVPARGRVLGHELVTTVDSQSAADYLADFDAMLPVAGGASSVRAGLPDCSPNEISSDALEQLSQRHSVDTAALYAATCLIRQNWEIMVEFQATLDRLRRSDAGGRDAAARRLRTHTLVFVPGWDYVDSGSETGADYVRQRELFTRLGVENILVTIDPNGSVEENAAVVVDTIQRLSATGRRLVVVSASSGSLAAALALGGETGRMRPAAVEGWLNLGGILGGMPLIDVYSSGLRRHLLNLFIGIQGWRTEAVESMSRARSHARLATLHIPESLKVFNYVGIPLTGDISDRARFFHSGLLPLGPNDGLTLITDPILPGTQSIVALGQDHFFADDPELELKTLALASVIGRRLEGRRRLASLR